MLCLNCKKYFAEFKDEFGEFIFEFAKSKDENSKFIFGNSVSKVGDAEFKVDFDDFKDENTVFIFGNATAKVGDTNIKDEFAAALFEGRVNVAIVALIYFVPHNLANCLCLLNRVFTPDKVKQYNHKGK